MWWVKLIVMLLLVAATVALFRALWALVRNEGGSRRTMRQGKEGGRPVHSTHPP